MHPSSSDDARPADETGDATTGAHGSVAGSKPDEALGETASTASETPRADAASSARADEGDDAPAEPSAPMTLERDEVQVQARLAPRYGRFMALGALLGFGGGYLWSRLGGSGPLLGAGPVVDTSVVVPFLMIVGAIIGIVLGALVAIVLDRVVGRRRRIAYAERTRRHRG